MKYVITNGELYHFGTPGMSWHNRNYQNKDGTWTELGKERRRKEGGMSRDEKRAMKIEKKKAKIEKKKERINRQIELNRKKEEAERLKMEAKYAKRDLHEAKHFNKIKDNLMKSGTAEDVLKYSSHFDANELDQVLNRLRAEEAVRQIAAAQKPKKKEKNAAEAINKIANIAGAAGNVITQGTNAYNSFAKVYNSLVLDKDMKLPVLDGKAKYEKEAKPGKASAEYKRLMKELGNMDFDKMDANDLSNRMKKIGLIATFENAEKGENGLNSLLGIKYTSPSAKTGNNGNQNKKPSVTSGVDGVSSAKRGETRTMPPRLTQETIARPTESTPSQEVARKHYEVTSGPRVNRIIGWGNDAIKTQRTDYSNFMKEVSATPIKSIPHTPPTDFILGYEEVPYKRITSAFRPTDFILGYEDVPTGYEKRRR